jgi:hypothetical protein
MEELLKYYMEETNKRITSMESKLEDLTKFKIEMVASARTTSLVVSGLCGLITMIVSVGVAIYTGRGH